MARATTLAQDIKESISQAQNQERKRLYISLGLLGAGGVIGTMMAGPVGLGLGAVTSQILDNVFLSGRTRAGERADTQIGELLYLMHGYEDRCMQVLKEAGVDVKRDNDGAWLFKSN